MGDKSQNDEQKTTASISWHGAAALTQPRSTRLVLDICGLQEAVLPQLVLQVLELFTACGE